MAEANVHNASVLVPSWGMDEFNKRLAALNVKAAKYGLPPIVAGEPTRQRYARRTQQDEDGLRVYMVPMGDRPAERGDLIVYINEMDLAYPIVKLGNYQVLAKVEPLPTGNVLFSVTRDPADAEAIEAYRTCELNCDHCQTKRQRKETYILRDLASGESKQVGSSCLEDYTGVNPSAVLFLAQLNTFYRDNSDLDSWGDGFGGGRSGGDYYVSAQEFLTRVVFLVERRGYLSSTKVFQNPELGNATYADAMVLDDALKRSHSLQEAFDEARPRLQETAKTVVEWWLKHEPTGDYELNLKTILQASEVRWDRKYLSFVASAVPSYQRYLQKSLQSTLPSEHQGDVGDKMERALRLEKRLAFDTQYGTSFRLNLADADGNRFSWKTANPPRELDGQQSTGQWFSGKFKIKKHDEYNGVKINEISHVKFVGWVSDPRPKDTVEVEEAGRRVAALMKEASSDEPQGPYLVATIDRVTEAFDATGWRTQAACVLTGAVQTLNCAEQEHKAFELKDTDGNAVGQVTFEDEPPQAPDGDAMQLVLAPGTRQQWMGLLERAEMLLVQSKSDFDIKDMLGFQRGALAWKGAVRQERRAEFVAKSGKDAHSAEVVKQIEAWSIERGSPSDKGPMAAWLATRSVAKRLGVAARPVGCVDGEVHVEYLKGSVPTGVTSRFRPDGSVRTSVGDAAAPYLASREEQLGRLRELCGLVVECGADEGPRGPLSETDEGLELV